MTEDFHRPIVPGDALFDSSHGISPERSESCRPVHERISKYAPEIFEFAKTKDRAIWMICVRCFAAHKQLSAVLELPGDTAARLASLKKERRRALDALQVARAKTIYGLLLKQNILLLFLIGDEETASLLRSCLADYDRLFAITTHSELSHAEPNLAPLVEKVFKAVAHFELEADRYDQFDDDGRDRERNLLFTSLRTAITEVGDAVTQVAAQPAATFQGLRAKLLLFESFDETSGDGVALVALNRSMCADLDRLLRQFRSAPPLLGAPNTQNTGS